MTRFFLWCGLLGLVYADNETNLEGPAGTNLTVGEGCNGTNTKDPVFTYVSTNQTVREDCKDCISKCCPGTQIYIEESCVENVYGVKKLEDMDVEIYTNDISKTDLTMKKFTFVYSDLFNRPSSQCSLYGSIYLYPAKGETLYMLENGKYFLRRANYVNQWGDPYHRHFFPKLCIRAILLKLAMLVSCLFLLLVLAAYAVLPQKRNLPSLMVMAYVTCLATAFLFIPVQVFTSGQIGPSTCMAVGLTVYYTFLASFTWINVMSYDMWSTTSKSQMPRWEPRSKILAKFGWYSLYGFGAPLLTMLFLIGINYADLTSMPDFIQPHYGTGYSCTFETEDERKLYVNAPMLVATVINIFFCVMTGLYIWRNSSKPGGTGESRNTKKDQSRFIIYVKLTLIMGVNWILDVASAFISPNSKVWYISDVFNSLVGLFIFIIFVCKKDMFLLLCKRFSIETKFARQWESTVETSVSVSKRQLSDKEDGSTNMLPDGLSEKPSFYNNGSHGRY